jgi:hypothetical protein
MAEQIYEPLNQGDLSTEKQRALFELLGDQHRVTIYDTEGPADRSLSISQRKFHIRQDDGSYKPYTGISLTYSSRAYDSSSYSDCRDVDSARVQAAEHFAAKTDTLPKTRETLELLNEVEAYVKESRKKAHDSINNGGIRSRRDLPDNLRKVLDDMPPNNDQHISIYHEGMEGNHAVLYTADIGTGGNSYFRAGRTYTDSHEVLIDPATGKFVEGMPNPEAHEHHLRNRVPNELAQTLFEAHQNRVEEQQQRRAAAREGTKEIDWGPDVGNERS